MEKRLTIKDLMKASGYSRDTVMKLANEGILPCERDANNWRIFPIEAIDIIKEYAGIKNKTTTNLFL